jgi:23S rRNA pseudouridine2605 synthase
MSRRAPAGRGNRHRASGVSLERALSKLGAASRTRARALILAGRVRADGRVVTNPATRVVPESVRLTIGDAPVRRSSWRAIAFHKPRGAITTRRDPEGRTTVFDLLGEAGAGLIAVGRLDAASTGLLLLTNDTQLANRLTDPRGRITRRYLVTVRGRVSADDVRALEQGLDVGGERGVERLHAARVDVRKASGRETHLVIDLTEGKNREVRRLLAAIGHEVTRLHRVAFGSIELGMLAPGTWRELTREDFRGC